MLGILGGTFDPIHYGHLHIAQALYQQLHLQEVRFIPCKNPLLGKKLIANVQQRLAMLQRALLPYPYFSIDERELKRTTPSYTLDTLISLRQELGSTPLVFILGSDRLENLNHWHEWNDLIQYTHFVVVPRPCHATSYPAAVQAFIKKFQVSDPMLLSQQAAGFLLITSIKPLAISATTIRAEIASGIQPAGLLPPTVLDYISQHKLYL
jgi:nicotinate-nucleotide adenylyltransferase